MSCDNNQPKPFLPVIPDPYDSLTDGIERFDGVRRTNEEVGVRAEG